MRYFSRFKLREREREEEEKDTETLLEIVNHMYIQQVDEIRVLKQ